MALQRSKGRTVRKASVPTFDQSYTRTSYQSYLANIGLFYSENSTNTTDNGLDQRWQSQNITPGTVVPYGTTIGINYYIYVYPGFSHYAGFYHGFYHGFTHYAGFYHGFYHGFTHYASFAHYAGFYHGFYHGFSHYAAFGHYGSFGHGYGGFYHGFYTSFAHGYGGFYHGFSHGYAGFGHYGGFAGFGTFWYSIGGDTGLLTPTGVVTAENLKVGDTLLALDISEIDMQNFNPAEWTSETLSGNGVVETTVVNISARVSDQAVIVNGDIYSMNHWILARKDGLVQFVNSSNIDTTYEVYNYQTLDWTPVTGAEVISYIDRVYSINCEPYDMFFTNSMLVYDIVER
jgi:hypothetical protein